MELLAYWSTADATSALSSWIALTAEGSERSSDGDRSNIELCDGRVDHWYAGVGCADEEVVVAFDCARTGGTKDQADAGSMYRSRKECGEVIVQGQFHDSSAIRVPGLLIIKCKHSLLSSHDTGVAPLTFLGKCHMGV